MSDFDFFSFLWVRNRPVFDVAGTSITTTPIYITEGAGFLFDDAGLVLLDDAGNPLLDDSGTVSSFYVDESGNSFYVTENSMVIQQLSYTLVRFD